MSNYAKVVVSVGMAVDKAFDYAVPVHMPVQVGSRVLVPFGKRSLEGFVVSISATTDFDPTKVKEISDIIDDAPIFSPTMLELASFMAKKYTTPLATCLRAIMPSGIGLKNEYIVRAVPEYTEKLKGKQAQVLEYVRTSGTCSQRELTEVFGKNAQTVLNALQEKQAVSITHIYEAKDFVQRVRIAHFNEDNQSVEFDELCAQIIKKGGAAARVLEFLRQNRAVPVSDLAYLTHVSMSPIKSLEQKGIITIEQTEIRRDVVKVTDETHEPFELSDEQAHALDKLYAVLEQKPSSRRPVLIQGVTGSGKTELYIRTIQRALEMDKQALVLVPEISLTPQTISAFTARFGDAVTATHSRLSLGERYDQWKKARDGQVSVVIGPRSALFTPFSNLGVIIIDEEHEHTYKSGTTPKYSTHAVAIQLAKLTGAMVVMGSATPRLETYYKAQTGDYELITLKNRINNLMLDPTVVDMRAELAQGNKSIFSVKLYAALKNTIEKGEQAILFINRRGHSTFVSCRSCGHVCACEECSVNYTYHRHTGKMICHYCAKTVQNPKNCPTCGSIYIKYFGVGTQKIEEYLKDEFPNTKVLRMDMDTTTKKNAHNNIIEQFARGDAQILIGTQMIAKGLNFPSVSLVGIVAADIALNNGDFAAAENAYQLITQVSGRAGRGAKAGDVIIQTYAPDAYAIKYAVQDNYIDFYNHELTIRKQMNYPPYTHVYEVMMACPDEKRLIKTLHLLVAIMKQANRKGLCEVLGPAPCQVVKIKQAYRWKLMVKCADEDILSQYVHYCIDKLKQVENIEGIKLGLTPG